ncbi:MAG: YafY family transcriptional regulator [Treponemataceae bacterium]|nr:YafY family transcriptional regulator [Treponemataceae bacterium]
MQVNNRLFEIVYILLQKKKITARELAEKFEVSTRTIYRDVETLSRANVPIYATQGKDGGIALLDRFVLNKTILSEEEQNQILFALQSMKNVSGQDEKGVLEKLSTLFNKAVSDWIKIDFSGWKKDGAQKARFDMIKKAILNKSRIEFVYYNSNGEKSKRIAEPLQIWFKDKSWYLMSYCKLKEDYRIFKISRMKEIKMLREHFERELPKEQKDKTRDFKIISLKLEISKDMAYRVYDEFENEGIVKNKNGDFVVKAEYPENEWVWSYVLSFGEYAKVLSPKRAKEIIKGKLEKSLEKYL